MTFLRAARRTRRAALFPGFGEDAPLEVPFTPVVERDLRDLIVTGRFHAFAAALSRVANCARPIRLRGSSDRIDAATGEVLSSYDSASEPLGVTHVRCGNRRASECPSCSRVYAADMFQLLRAGVCGGKTVPESVADNPLAERAVVQYAKVAEYQLRGVIHFHALVRLDGPRPAGSYAPAPLEIDQRGLAGLVQAAAESVRMKDAQDRSADSDEPLAKVVDLRTREVVSAVRVTYTVPEVAAMLGICRSTAYALLRTGDIPARRVGSRWIIARRRLNQWLEDDPRGAER